MFEPSEFFRFLRRPKYLTLERKETNVFGSALKIYLALLLFVGLSGGVIIIVLSTFLTLPVDETLEIPNRYKDQVWIFFLIVAIIAPFIEEIIFRLALLFSPLKLSLSISVLIALYVHKISSHLITVLIFFTLLFLTLWILKTYKAGITSFWNNNFAYIFYFLCIAFAVVHIGNYRFTDKIQYLIAPILIMPQLAMGLVFSFTRLYYQKGFLISVLVHMIMNTFSVSIFLLSTHQ